MILLIGSLELIWSAQSLGASNRTEAVTRARDLGLIR